MIAPNNRVVSTIQVTIITVCFNSEQTIENTIRSVLAQDYPNIEYIVIDGKSTDKTVSVISSFATKNRNLTWISEKDRGIYDAINKGIGMASGEVIGILNSDDVYVDNNVISRVVGTLVDKGVDSIFADVRFVKDQLSNKTIRYYSSEKFYPEKMKYGYMPAHPTFFTYRKFFDQLGYYKPDYRIAGDFELMIRFLYLGRLSYCYLPEPLVKMSIGGVSTRSIISSVILNREILRACSSNGIRTNACLLVIRYFKKIWEFVFVRQTCRAPINERETRTSISTILNR